MQHWTRMFAAPISPSIMSAILKRFTASLGDDHPPSDAPPPIQALWWDAKGEWDKAHQCVDSLEDADGMLVHAYLHRKEGDLGNASYWYRRTGHPVPNIALQEEWQAILCALVGTEESG